MGSAGPALTERQGHGESQRDRDSKSAERPQADRQKTAKDRPDQGVGAGEQQAYGRAEDQAGEEDGAGGEKRNDATGIELIFRGRPAVIRKDRVGDNVSGSGHGAFFHKWRTIDAAGPFYDA